MSISLLGAALREKQGPIDRPDCPRAAIFRPLADPPLARKRWPWPRPGPGAAKFLFQIYYCINDPPESRKTVTASGSAENTRSAAALEAGMPARSFVVGDGVCILGEHAKPTTRARLPKRVRPTSPVLGQKPGGVQGFSPETVARLELVSSIEFG